MAASADDLIRDFCAAWSRADVNELMTYFAEGAVYHNIPMEPTVGREAIREFLNGFLAMANGFEFIIERQVADGNVVMNERIDKMNMGDKAIALAVAGVFEVADGKIVAWRDYFDMGQAMGS